MYKTSAEFEPKTMLYQWQYVQNQYRIRKYRCSSWRYSYSSLAGDTHTQAKPVLKSIEYLLILILIARIGNHTHDYLSIQVLSCHPSYATRTTCTRHAHVHGVDVCLYNRKSGCYYYL